MNKKTIQDTDVKGKKVIVRVDFNVPLDLGGQITDDSRIKAALPTISYLKGKGALIILMSHLGRPKGKINEDLRLAVVADKLAELMGQEILYAKDCIGEEPKQIIDRMKPGKYCFWKICAFTPKKKRMTRPLPKN